MSLAKFRERQKLILWFIAIILVPCFMFFGLGLSHSRQDQALIKVDGKIITRSKLVAFMNRMRAINPYLRFSFDKRGLFMAGGLLYQIQEAKRSGIKVSDAEIGSFIRGKSEFKNSKTGKFDFKTYQQRLENYYQLSPSGYRKGVEEIKLLNKHYKIIDGCRLVSPLEAYTLWSKDEATVSYANVEVKIADYTKQATKNLVNFAQEIKTYLAENENEQELRTQGKWHLEYLVAPYAKMADFSPSAKRLKEYYEKNKNKYAQKKLAEVKADIEKKLRNEQRKSTAERIVSSEIDPLLIENAGSGSEVTAAMIMEKLRGFEFIEKGDTGKQNLTLDELNKHKMLGQSSSLLGLLRDIEEATPKEQAKRLKELRHNFNKRRDGKNLRGKAGVFKVRILDYQPGRLRDPEKDKNFKKIVIEKIINAKAAKLAQTEIKLLQEKITDGGELPKTIKSKQGKLQDFPDLATPELRVGEPTKISTDEDGFKFKVLLNRDIPAYAQFNQQKPEVRKRFLQQVGRYRRSRLQLANAMNMNSEKIKLLVKLQD